MKKKGTSFLFYLFVITFSVSLKAQPSFFVPNQVVDPGQFVNADVKVSSFSDIIGIQFSVDWDSTVLRYLGLQDFAMDITEESNFGTNNAGSGNIGFFWFDEAVTGVSLDDSTSLFSIKFEVVGDYNDSTLISFTNSPTQIEIVDTSLIAIEADFIEGTILVDQMVSANERIPEWISIGNAFPNPFSEHTQINLKVDKSIDTQILIYNNHGQLVYKTGKHFHSGENTLQLDKNIFPAKGSYFLKMQSQDFLITQKLDFF